MVITNFETLKPGISLPSAFQYEHFMCCLLLGLIELVYQLESSSPHSFLQMISKAEVTALTNMDTSAVANTLQHHVSTK